jgi:hypothetical protein
MARRLSEIKEAIFTGSLRRQQANYFGSGSVIDGLATDVANLLFELEANQEAILGSIHLDSVSNDQLTRFARDFNVRPEIARRAYSLESDANVVLSTTNGQSLDKVFLDNNIILPGLRVSNGDRTKIYVIEGTSTNTSVATSCFVTVRSLDTGTASNLNKGELTRLEKAYKNLRITNNFGIYNGSDNESNAALKDRILYKVESNLKNRNILNILLAKIPGYGKSVVIENYDGPNTLLICVQPASDLYFPNSVLDDMRTTVSNYVGAGTRVIVKNFDPVTFRIKTQIVATDNNNAASLVEPVKGVITRYFDTIQGGESIDLADISSQVLSQVSGVKLVSRAGSGFDEVTYSVYEGTSEIGFSADPTSTISIGPTQIATLESLIVNYE